MRLIEADALLAEFDKREAEPEYQHEGEDWYCGLISGEELVMEAPTIKPEQQWIPCSERLPNLYEYTKNNGLFIVSDGNRSYSEWYDIYDKRRFGEPTMNGFRIDYAVTAWMPLPEPWREENR